MGASKSKENTRSRSDLGSISSVAHQNESTNYSDMPIFYRQPGVMVFDILNRITRISSYSEVCTYSHLIHDEECAYAIFCYKPSPEDIRNIKNIYGLHDIIEIECKPDRICHQDFILNFNDCTLITITDFSVKDNIEDHITIKIIVFKSILFIISWEPLYSVERAFAEELKYVDCSLVNKPTDHLNYSNLHRKNTISLFSLESVMELDFMSSELNVYLYKIFEVIILRFEKVVVRLYEESKQHLLYAMEISHYERADFILRLSLAKKHLIMIQELVEPKINLFKMIKQLFGRNSDIKYYMSSLQHHAEVLNNRINSSTDLIKISENLYQANVDNALTQSSLKLNLSMQHFSAIATCFLPLNLIAGLWGMNVVVPGMEEKTEYPFGIIIGIVLFLGTFSFLYFKFRRWV